MKVFVDTERLAAEYVDADTPGRDGLHPDHVSHYAPDERSLELVGVQNARETPFGEVIVEFENNHAELGMASISGVEQDDADDTANRQQTVSGSPASE